MWSRKPLDFEVILEEGQHAVDVRTTLSLSHLDERCIMIIVGDDKKAPGGIEDDADLKLLRGASIGLRALDSSEYRSPYMLPNLLVSLIDTMGHLHSQGIQQHVQDVCVPSRPNLVHAAMPARAEPGSAVPHHTPASPYIYTTPILGAWLWTIRAPSTLMGDILSKKSETQCYPNK